MVSYKWAEMIDISGYAEAFNMAQTTSEIEEVMGNVVAQLGMDYFLLGVSIPVSLLRGYTVVYNNYPKEWRDEYEKNNYVQIDPVVIHCSKSTLPLDWQELQAQSSSKQERSFFERAKYHGLVSGVSVPVHGSKSELGILSFASKRECHSFSTEEYRQMALTAQIVAPIAFSKAVELETSGVTTKGSKLTQREKDVLYWAAEGKTTWEISQILGCSERTVYFHLNNATKKLDVVNRYQAVSKAILLGYIRPSVSNSDK